MLRNQKMLTTILVLAWLLASGCDRSSTASNADAANGPIPTKQEAKETSWEPKWNTRPDKSRKDKSPLSPIVSFSDEGFRGSPVPQNERETKQELKNREDFVQSFRSERDCFGVTLTLKNPKAADFGLQTFNGIDGRVGQWQWVVYRMDTLGAVAIGTVSGAGTSMGLDRMVKSVCSAIHDATSNAGGQVEGE